jgi:hypothetical protein
MVFCLIGLDAPIKKMLMSDYANAREDTMLGLMLQTMPTSASCWGEGVALRCGGTENAFSSNGEEKAVCRGVKEELRMY